MQYLPVKEIMQSSVGKKNLYMDSHYTYYADAHTCMYVADTGDFNSAIMIRLKKHLM